MDRYIDLLIETRVADDEEAKRLSELNQGAEVAHERARIAVVALDVFDEAVTVDAARDELVALEHRECEQARAAEFNLRLYRRAIRHDREQRHEDLTRVHEDATWTRIASKADNA